MISASWPDAYTVLCNEALKRGGQKLKPMPQATNGMLFDEAQAKIRPELQPSNRSVSAGQRLECNRKR